MSVQYYPKCPNCGKVIEDGGAMKRDERRVVECKTDTGEHCMTFEAACEILVPQRTSYLLGRKAEIAKEFADNIPQEELEKLDANVNAKLDQAWMMWQEAERLRHTRKLLQIFEQSTATRRPFILSTSQKLIVRDALATVLGEAEARARAGDAT